MEKSRTMVGIEIQELTQTGFISITKIFLEKEIDNLEEKKKLINDMTKALYNSETFFTVNIDGEIINGCVIKGIQNKTFKIEMILK